MADLRTDYKDDILDLTQNTQRKYRMITNDDGTVSFEDVTDYLQVGDSFGSADVNAITEYIQKNLAYKNITDKFTADTSKIVIGAYAENGSVFITTRVREGVTGVISAQLNDLTYAPRTYAAGTYASMSSAADKDKFVGAGLTPEGVLTIWLDSALSVGENVTFTYPLRTES